MRIGLITSNHTRHRYVANVLARDHELVLVLAEEKKRNPAAVEGTLEERDLVGAYFRDRAESERLLLASGQDWDPAIGEVVPVPAGAINEPEWAQRMQAADVSVVAVYGSSILREPWLAAFPRAMVNMHLGLSPYYRGAGTNFWPLYYAEPEYVGATIHVIDPGVDSGPILRHARPWIYPDDTPHSIGNQAIRAGARALSRSLHEYVTGQIAPVPQWEVPNSRYFKNRDFNPAILRTFLSRWEAGLLPRALSDFQERRNRVRLVRELSHE
jgi:methionyl-tRNA formyltransferase